MTVSLQRKYIKMNQFFFTYYYYYFYRNMVKAGIYL